MEIKKLLSTVFRYKKNERVLVMYDTPKGDFDRIKDNRMQDWKKRISLAKYWTKELKDIKIPCRLISYNATCANNSDLPKYCFEKQKEMLFDDIFSRTDIVISLTEFSATAPLHTYAKIYGFRGSSMPGFNDKMISALEIDYNDVAKKVDILYRLFLDSDSADIVFSANNKEHNLHIDLKGTRPLKDDGQCFEKEKIINLPSGEAFVSPNDNNDSKTKGLLPIQYKNKLRIYEIKNNCIIGCLTKNDELMSKIICDPAVGNIAELAFGVLGLYNIKPSGRTLLDEKLGMHIALGRNDHFGGKIGINEFKKKEHVWHQDFVYVNEMQPDISIKSAVLNTKKEKRDIIKNSKYMIF